MAVPLKKVHFVRDPVRCLRQARSPIGMLLHLRRSGHLVVVCPAQSQLQLLELLTHLPLDP